MVVLTAMLYWLLTDASFRVTEASVSFEGLRHADEAAVRDHLSGLEREPNVFRVRASEIVDDLHALPEVASAAATVTLPARWQGWQSSTRVPARPGYAATRALPSASVS